MDARKKKVLTVLVISSVILVWRVYALITAYGPAAVQAQAGAVDAGLTGKGAVSFASSWLELPPEQAQAQRAVENQPWGRDPFLVLVRRAEPSEQKKDTTPSAVVQQPDPPQVNKFRGVSRSGDRWLAAIDGRIYRVGDVFDGRLTITEITSNSVTMTQAGWAFTFTLGSQSPTIRQPTEQP